MTLWILFCLFASVGLVQCGVWLFAQWRTPAASGRSYHIIPLYDDAEKLEEQLRFGLSRIRRAGGKEPVLLVDMGLAEESQQICEKILWGYGGVYICAASDLVETIARIERVRDSAY